MNNNFDRLSPETQRTVRRLRREAQKYRHQRDAVRVELALVREELQTYKDAFHNGDLVAVDRASTDV